MSVLFLKIIPHGERAIDPEELILHLRIAVAYNRNVVLEIKYQLTVGIEAIERGFTAV